ncbi:DapH/DapD/GlmU-related protein [Lactobacillus helveticus]|jgi:acetyltransferase-like isoleucine patch superfamily enzyme|uniref:DapH/DapD/GlmU-related protein n=1 Tax=Lactobacillus helveticus TaxID=1587 RepID=UPI001A04EA4A|nr:DapH/DapD/GlmU-related protein [Lactobacillus helveticus]NRO50988.1 putative acetyltransferase [Lactobacillus helveticus]NRO68477.1 putative acetyltransferase [Lactobacillus helveticus]NRO70313.1 putative acetyltransferase [Lactobacillus helveticus]
MNAENQEIMQQIISQNQRLLQNLNTQRHCSCEVQQLVSEIIGDPVADTTEIRLPFYSDYGRNIKLGERVFINANVMMVDLGGITIEDDVLIGSGAYLISVNHQLDPHHRKELELKPVLIKKNAWIGAKATILPGVTVGENAVVAAGAVVTKDVPANTVVAGMPAKVIKKSTKKDVMLEISRLIFLNSFFIAP